MFCPSFKKVFIGHWFLVLGSWFLVLGHWSLVIGSWSLVIGSWFLVLSSWSLVIGHWSLVIGHWSLVIDGLWFVVCDLPGTGYTTKPGVVAPRRTPSHWPGVDPNPNGVPHWPHIDDARTLRANGDREPCARCGTPSGFGPYLAR